MPKQKRDVRVRNVRAARQVEKDKRMRNPGGKSRYGKKAASGGSEIWMNHPDQPTPEPPRQSYDPYASVQSSLETSRRLSNRARGRSPFGTGYLGC